MIPLYHVIVAAGKASTVHTNMTGGALTPMSEPIFVEDGSLVVITGLSVQKVKRNMLSIMHVSNVKP